MKYALYKVLNFAVTVVIASVLVFLAFQVLPGDTALLILGPEADKAQVEALRQELGLNRPLARRYADWALGVATGDLGTSYRYKQPVSALILGAAPVTLSLALLTLVMTIVASVPASVFLAGRRGRAFSAASQLALAIPAFWMGILLTSVFSVILKLFPGGGYTRLGLGVGPWLASLFLPALALALGNTAYVCRFLSASLRNELQKAYVLTARSKGMSNFGVLMSVVLRNALVPAVTAFGMIAAEILGGGVIVERVFNLPGLGSLLIDSIGGRDFTLLMSLCFYMALLVAAINLAVDLLYRLIDPRMKI